MVATRRKPDDSALALANDGASFRAQIFIANMMENAVRTLAFSRTGSMRLDPADRNLDRDCGYNLNPDTDYLYNLHSQHGVAARVNHIWPDECWAAHPEMYETEAPEETPFEKRWKEVVRRTNPWHYLHRVDRLSGVGRYGVLLFGLNDGAPLDNAVTGLNPRTGEPRSNKSPLDLLYLRAFPEKYVAVKEVEADPSNPRFGQPTLYQIEFYADQMEGGGFNLVKPRAALRDVHWTRILHVADNRESSEVFGIPRAKPVLPYLYDIRKVGGGSAEMFWKGAFPGYSFQGFPDLGGQPTVDKAEIREEIAAYTSGLQRFLTAFGGEWKSLAPQVADPSKHLSQQFTMLCAAIGVPIRIFLGTESGHLASTQDAGTWKERLRGRQKNYLEPMVVRPFVERLMAYGVLPRVNDFILGWRDLKTLGDKDAAEVALKKTQALMQYVTGKVFMAFPLRVFLTTIIGLSEQEVNAVVKALGGEVAARAAMVKMAEKEAEPRPAAPQGGGRNGRPNRGTNGRPAGRVAGRGQSK